ncbi:MAG: vanadium-dependent haloperoxidase [Ferruginibacter sp.]|nr:vanadium-dependent haloperoxidase [Cytophagales bacterium]
MKKLLISLNIFFFSLSLLLTGCDHLPFPWEPGQIASRPVSGQLLADWLGLQFKLIRTTRNVGAPFLGIHFAYSSIALYESIVHSDPRYRSLGGQLQDLASLPAPPKGTTVCWSASANAALASMLRAFYGRTPGHTPRIDSLEAVYAEQFARAGYSQTAIQAGTDYGRSVAQAVLEYARTGGSATVHPPYVAPVGEGLWEPTPPSFTPAEFPYWGTNRTFVKGSIADVLPPAPPVFSTAPASAFYAMVKEVYDVSNQLTKEQERIARYWEDVPNGQFFSAQGHWSSILRAVITQRKLSLLESSVAYAKMSIAMSDASIAAFRAKYTHNLIRPVTYIHRYFKQPTWRSWIISPNHPEYPSAHASLAMAAATALSEALGSTISFTDRSYEDVGFPVRNYQSFEAAAQEAGISRLYAGVNYKPSVEAGQSMGRKTAHNVITRLRFRHY